MSPSTPKVGGTIIAANTSRNIGWLRASMTGSSSRKWLRIPDDPSSTEKFKKSPLKKGNIENLWTDQQTKATHHWSHQV